MSAASHDSLSAELRDGGQVRAGQVMADHDREQGSGQERPGHIMIRKRATGRPCVKTNFRRIQNGHSNDDKGRDFYVKLCDKNIRSNTLKTCFLQLTMPNLSI